MASDIKDRSKTKPASKAKSKSAPKKVPKVTSYCGLYAVPPKLKPDVDALIELLTDRLKLVGGQKIDFGGAYLGCPAYKRIRRHTFLIEHIGVNTGDETQDKTYVKDDPEFYYLCALAEDYLATRANTTCGDNSMIAALLGIEATGFTKDDEPVEAASTLGRDNLIRHVGQSTGINGLTEDDLLTALRIYGGWELSALIREENSVDDRFRATSEVDTDTRTALQRQGTMMQIAIACKKFDPPTVVENMLAQIADETPPVGVPGGMREGTADSPETRA